MDELTFSDLIDISSLQMIQDSFAEYTGLAFCILTSKGEIAGHSSGCTGFCDGLVRNTQAGLERCKKCDRDAALRVLAENKGMYYTCHAGLTDFAIPIRFENRTIGCILAGKVRTGEIDEEFFRQTAAELGIEPDKLIREAKKVKYISKEEADRLVKFLTDFSNALSVMAHSNYRKTEELRKTERIAKSQSTFITGLTEDLRTGMAGWIESFRAAAEKYSGDPKVKKETEALLCRAGEVYSQIGGAVDYIRMAGGSAEYSESVYNVRTVIENAAASLETHAEETGVTVSTAFDSSLPELLAGNPGRIGQIINKLGGNIMNFTNSGGSLEISASCVKTDYSCSLAVRLKGTGTRMTEKAAGAIRAAVRGGGSNAFGSKDQLTSKDLDFPLLLLLLRQMSGTIEAEELENGTVSFLLTIPQLDGTRGE